MEFPKVLILLFLEYGLRLGIEVAPAMQEAVLILLFLEYGLRLVEEVHASSNQTLS